MFLNLNVGNLTEPVAGRSWSSEQTAREVAARIRRYDLEGLQPGDRVFLHFGNRLEFFAELLALWRLGACAVPIDSRLTPFEVETLARTATPRFSIVDDETDAGTAGAMSSANNKVLNTLDIDRDGGVAGSRTGSRLDDDALILFTSGSTGSPKGVVLTHRALRARWISLSEKLGLEPYRRTLCLLPTHFGHGLICNCLFPWLSGQDLFITPPFKPDLIMRLGTLIDEHEITFLSSVPSMWRLALKTARAPSKKTLRRVHCGSAPLHTSLWKEIESWSGTQVFNAYGITETGSWTAGTTIGDFTPEDGLIGEPWGGVIKILTSRETDAQPNADMECAPDEPGYVWINTPALMRGYFNRDDLTKQVVREGWFMTGDVGFLDKRGRLYLKGRVRDEINKGGTKIYPADIDAVVERFDRTADVCAFGFDDPFYGQNVGMAVVLTEPSDGTIGELYGWMKNYLPEHKMPIRWYVLDSIQRTSRGKVNRDAVMQACTKLEPVGLTKILQASKGRAS